tara:strand:- start:422 stop:1078 length:657 start_codon:yes stop_codon:yes gene_type:complete
MVAFWIRKLQKLGGNIGLFKDKNMIDTKNEMLNDLNASFTKGKIYSHSELRSFLESNKLFSVKNVAAYTYNRWNRGMIDIFPVLEWINRGTYKFLGTDFEYNGIIIHHPQGGIPYKIGHWENGKLFFFGRFDSFADWCNSTDDGIKVADLNSKIVFESSDGKITQKKILTDSRDDDVTFEKGYSLTLFDSTLGKLLRFNTEGDTFDFGNFSYIIKQIN